MLRTLLAATTLLSVLISGSVARAEAIVWTLPPGFTELDASGLSVAGIAKLYAGEVSADGAQSVTYWARARDNEFARGAFHEAALQVVQHEMTQNCLSYQLTKEERTAVDGREAVVLGIICRQPNDWERHSQILVIGGVDQVFSIQGDYLAITPIDWQEATAFVNPIHDSVRWCADAEQCQSFSKAPE